MGIRSRMGGNSDSARSFALDQSSMSQVISQAQLKLAAEGLVQQRLLQLLQRGELLLVDGFEALGFF